MSAQIFDRQKLKMKGAISPTYIWLTPDRPVLGAWQDGLLSTDFYVTGKTQSGIAGSHTLSPAFEVDIVFFLFFFFYFFYFYFFYFFFFLFFLFLFFLFLFLLFFLFLLLFFFCVPNYISGVHHFE